jgi:hypothetical protein
VGGGKFGQTSGSVENANKISEGGNSTDKRTNSNCQNEYIGYNNAKQQHAPDKNNLSNERFASSIKNLLAVDNNDFIKITCDNADLSHLKGNELHMAIKNLEDQSESIKVRNERAEEDKKSAKYLDMTLTMIEDMYNSKDEEELEL